MDHAQKVINAFEAYVNSFVELTTTDEYNHTILQAVLELLKEKRWIPVSERLPEDGSDILAYYDNGIETRIIACNYYKGEWCDCVFNTETVFKYITHWMPLPEPPQEG